MKIENSDNQLKEILLAREERAELRNSIARNKNISIGINLNVPGRQKTNPLLKTFFDKIVQEFILFMKANRIQIIGQYSLNNSAGDFTIFEIGNYSLNVQSVKNCTEQFETKHTLGRFIDVDVCDSNGIFVSSNKLKPCFYCMQYSAIECIKSKRHSYQDLRNYQDIKINDYLNNQNIQYLSEKISTLALRSLLYEISLTPKPGLVDFNDNGIHNDMNFRMFIDSTASISPKFALLFRLGIAHETEDYNTVLPQIRSIGLQMEKEMFFITKGVNTQKGIIFLMGLSLYSLGMVFRRNEKYDISLHQTILKKICDGIVENEIQKNKTKDFTHGEICYKKYKTGGIRQEAEEGLPTVFNHALIFLQKKNNCENETLHQLLILIMSKLNDTNVLYRSDLQTLTELKEKCGYCFEHFNSSNYRNIIDFCQQNKISPGGSADLLSISLFLYWITQSNLNLKIYE